MSVSRIGLVRCDDANVNDHRHSVIGSRVYVRGKLGSFLLGSSGMPTVMDRCTYGTPHDELWVCMVDPGGTGVRRPRLFHSYTTRSFPRLARLFWHKGSVFIRQFECARSLLH